MAAVSSLRGGAAEAEGFCLVYRRPHWGRGPSRSCSVSSAIAVAASARGTAVWPRSAVYIELLGQNHSKPTVKQHLAAIRMLFDWLVTGQVIPLNPAHAVRGPRHSVKKGKTSVLSAEEMRTLLDSIDITTLIGLRDRALIAFMGYTFARVGAAVAMKVEDYYIQKRRGWVRLYEKGGKVNELPCHHNLEQFLDEWLSASGLAGEPAAPLFPTLRHGKL